VVEPQPGKARFHDFAVPDPVLHAVADLGFRYCTPIQAAVLPLLGTGRCVAGQAQTGTGKTAAFLILMVSRFLGHPRANAKPGVPRGLILAPTRELVVQIVNDAKAITRHTDVHVLGVFGGVDYQKQQRALESSVVDIVVATPGRLLDFKGRGHLNLGQVEVLVIDEADRMLDMGFIPDVSRIVRATPPREKRQTFLFSATLTDEVMRLSEQWLVAPAMVRIEPEQVAADSVHQLVYALSSREKFIVLYHLLRRAEVTRALVFCNRRTECDRVGDRLSQYGIACEVLSGDVPQARRLKVIEQFKAGGLRVVVATDVAGRGLHVEGISHVINFDLPYEAEAYIHRIGRTGRAGAAGVAISFACENEAFAIPEIEELLGEPLVCRQPEEILLQPLPRRLHVRHEQDVRLRAPRRETSNGHRPRRY
jgi:ATP-dependent RNA helicase RhlB